MENSDGRGIAVVKREERSGRAISRCICVEWQVRRWSTVKVTSRRLKYVQKQARRK